MYKNKYEKLKNNTNTSSHSAVNIYQWLIKSLQQCQETRDTGQCFTDTETKAGVTQCLRRDER